VTDDNDLDAVANENRSQRDILERQHRADLKDLSDLVAWLALKYGARNPQFPDVDPTTGQRLNENVRLSRTWYRWVRHGVKCDECDGAGHFLLPSDDPDVGTLRPCEPCAGRGWIEAGNGVEQETSGIDPEALTER
jgi:hypothetical protein